MDWTIAQLPGISAEDQNKLKEHGIETTSQLLQYAKTPLQQQALAAKLQVHQHHVMKWVALADLARIPAVGCQYSGLLLHVGIASVAQLAQVPAHRLHQQMVRFYVATLQRRDLCPPIEAVKHWIAQAIQLQNLAARRR